MQLFGWLRIQNWNPNTPSAPTSRPRCAANRATTSDVPPPMHLHPLPHGRWPFSSSPWPVAGVPFPHGQRPVGPSLRVRGLRSASPSLLLPRGWWSLSFSVRTSPLSMILKTNLIAIQTTEFESWPNSIPRLIWCWTNYNSMSLYIYIQTNPKGQDSRELKFFVLM